MSSASPPTRRRLTAAARRERIVEAASQVFAQRGYAHASLDEIAARAGVTKPVVYDHFGSKRELHRALLERHRDEILAHLAAHMTGEGPPQERIPRALDAWFEYVETHPYAWRMLFRDTTGDPELVEFHAGMHATARAAIATLLAREPAARGGPPERLEMIAELGRSAITGLAMWWHDHPEVPRARVVAATMEVLWVGFERLEGGQRWPEGPPR